MRIAIVLGALASLLRILAWLWDLYLAWWTAAGWFAHFNITMVILGLIAATIAKKYLGASWASTIGLAIGLPIVAFGAVLLLTYRFAVAFTREPNN